LEKYFGKASGIIGFIIIIASASLAIYTAYSYFDSNVTGQYQSVIAS
jgi:hypothetical protein